jgi:CRISPR/Cas system CSM-associated protein Csm3 (group 7 of RAMP superfamily)
VTVQFIHDLEFTARSPLAVGGAAIRADADLGVAVDGLGRFVIPGSSLAGVLRARCTQLVDAGDVDALFGGDPTATTSAASRVLVDDALVVLPEGAVPFVRAGVGIDRRTGAAAQAILHDRVVLPAGSSVQVRVTVEVPFASLDPRTDQIEAREDQLFGALKHDLRMRPLRIGAASSRGLGQLDLSASTVRTRDLNSAKGLIDALTAVDTSGVDTASRDADAHAALLRTRSSAALLDVSVSWQPVGPLMVKSTRGGMAADHLPYGEHRGDGWRLIVPGSSVKGAFRSTAERIVRTVLGVDVEMSFADQLAVPLVVDLFGSGPSKDRRGTAGVVWFDDVVASDSVAAEVVAALEAATTDDELRSALDGPQGPDTVPSGLRPSWTNGYHVAIDRWTGGAAKGLLYSGIEPWGEGWQPLRFTIDIDQLRHRVEHRRAADRTDGAPDPACSVDDEVGAGLQLVVLVLREFASGRIPLGFATNRGYGSVDVQCINLAGALDAELIDGIDQTGEPARWAVKQNAWDTWSTGWRTWLGEAS